MSNVTAYYSEKFLHSLVSKWALELPEIEKLRSYYLLKWAAPYTLEQMQAGIVERKGLKYSMILAPQYSLPDLHVAKYAEISFRGLNNGFCGIALVRPYIPQRPLFDRRNSR